MSADYFFIWLGSNNLNNKAFSRRTKSLGLRKSVSTRNAQITLDSGEASIYVRAFLSGLF